MKLLAQITATERMKPATLSAKGHRKCSPTAQARMTWRSLSRTCPWESTRCPCNSSGRDGKVLEAARHDLVRLADDFKPKAYIDEHRRLILDGKPFFPIGMYWSSINEADLKLYAESKFNCLMPYGPPTRRRWTWPSSTG